MNFYNFLYDTENNFLYSMHEKPCSFTHIYYMFIWFCDFLNENVMIQQFVLPGMGFAMSATFVPGPLIAYLVNTTLTQGWRKALLIVLSPIITDAPIIILMTFILGQLPPEILNLIRLGGGLLLLYIAYGAWQQYQSGVLIKTDTADETNGTQSWQRILATGVMMNYLSPGPYLFWATVNGPLLIEALNLSLVHAVAFLVAFYGTFMLGLSGWVFVFQYVRQIDVRYLRYVILITIGLLLWFGTSLILSALGIQIM